jgi:transglutaminase-like putative cysteine protease
LGSLAVPTDASFRFSTYLALALACVAVGYAEFALLPEVGAFAALAVVGLGALYFLESRVTFLSIPDANRLGMGVGIVYLMWAAYRIWSVYRTESEAGSGDFINMGWHMLIVALCGPLVMLVIVAKVARRDKHAGDYWALHGVALAGVGLAAAFAEEPACFVLVGMYLLATVWSLTLLHLGRARGAVPPIPGGRQPATKTVPVVADPTGHRTDLRPALLWAALAVAGAVPLYLLTPRSEAGKADFGKPRIEIGYSGDQMGNLNRTGPLSVNHDPAFEVTATYPSGRPKTDLDPEQRWRGKVRHHYARGEWNPRELARLPHLSHASLASTVTNWTPPDLGPGRFTLAFDVPARLGDPIVAEPVLWAPRQPAPLAVVAGDRPQSWMVVPDGTFFWEPHDRTRTRSRRYLQEYRTPARPGAGTPFRFADNSFGQQLLPLQNNPVPRAREYADAVLAAAVRAGKLSEQFREARSGFPRPEYRETVAQLLSDHLATPSASELRYTTDLKRENTAVDPVEDFLFYTKAGHCERFATALVMLLRSQHIPAVYVVGFKGCEHTEDGRYIVRQEHAHAWVEALVPVPGQPPNQEPLALTYQWRVFDPTPGGPDPGADDSGWLSRAGGQFETWFRDYVTNYTPEQRQKALAEFARGVARPETAVWLTAAVGLVFGVRFLLRRRARPAAPEPPPDPARWFAELLAVLAPHGLAPGPGETPKEFATATASALRDRPGCAELADVPLAWAEAYYRDRFGGAPPTADQLATLRGELAALHRALASRG